MSTITSGQERQVQFLGGANIDGAPVAYVVVFAAVVTALSFIPFSVSLGGGGGAFPLSQAILPLSGVILGPIAGTIANGIGTLIGVFVAPHTAGAIPLLTVLGNMIIGFAAGTIVKGKNRSKWWIIAVGISLIAYAFSTWLALGKNGVDIGIYLLFCLSMFLAYVLWFLPTRVLFSKWLSEKNLAKMAVALFFVTLMATIIGMNVTGAITYYMFAWPQEVFSMLIPMMPFEHFLRCMVGTIIGTGVITGLRAIGLTKAKWALY